MKNSRMMLIFLFVLRWKYLFLANLAQKIKVINLTWNLLPRLIRICRIRWWCSFFSVLDWKYPFWSNLVQIFKFFCSKWSLVPRLIAICRIQWFCSLFLFLAGNSFWGQIWSKQQNCQFKLEFGAWPIWIWRFQ